MKKMICGVIAITSTLTLACTTSAPGTDTEANKPSADVGDPGVGWKSTLAIAAPSKKMTAAAVLRGEKTRVTAGPARLRSGGGGSCGLSTGDATCDTCLDASCCAPNAACVGDADCTALVTCGNACRDDACFAACFSAHPTGAALLDTLSTCVETSCTTACGGPPDPPATSACGFGSGDASCDTCLDTNCCGAADACLADRDCTSLLDCEYACGDNTCVAACEAAHPVGATKLAALSTCAYGTCGAACSAVSGGGGGGGGGAGPSAGSCGVTSGEATCDACLDTSCCAESSACVGGPDCGALVTCYDACRDSTCAAACDAAHPTGSAQLNAIVTCAQSSCTAACGL